MRSSADNYCYASRSPAIAPVTMPCCWPRRRRRAPANGWWISAPASARPGSPLATRVRGIQLVMVEIDENLAELARHNAASNGIAADILALDVASDAGVFAAAGLNPDSVDVVLMNPPFNDPARHRASPDKAREIAHVAAEDTLASWVHAARRVLKSGGVLTLIWRADGLAQVLTVLDRGFGSPEDSAGSCRCRIAGDARTGLRYQRRQERHR